MNSKDWSTVDDYLEGALLKADPVLKQALADSQAAGLPAINVTPHQGKLLQMMAQMIGAKRILEVGTLGGYSTIWLARALPPEGRLITLEYAPKHAEVATANLARAGLSKQVEVRVGRAIELLPKLEPEAPFDFVFIDADKASNPDYFTWALKLTRTGSVIVVDNVVRSGAVTDPQGDASVQGIRRMMELIAAEPRVTATAIQTVGSKGWDGFCLLRVL